METFSIIMIVPWLMALVITPAVIRIATRLDWLDHPSERKVHDRPVALAGGIALWISVAGGLALSAPFVPQIGEGLWGSGSLAVVGAGAALIVLLGLVDDLRDLSPGMKLTVEVAVASATWFAGFHADQLALPLLGAVESGGIVSFVVTVAWIVAVTNAVNLIDGIDGLAAGISLISVLTVFLLANSQGATVPVIVALALAGGIAGFLRFNLPRARIFLGDAGALGLGYTIAVLAIGSYQKAPAGLALIVPLLALGLPVLDTCLAILRRGVAFVMHGERFSPRAALRAVTAADRGHLHHLLTRAGWTVPQTLAILYGVSAALAMLGLWTREVGPNLRWTLWLCLLAAGFAALRVLERRVVASENAAERARAEAQAQAEEDPGGRRAAS